MKKGENDIITILMVMIAGALVQYCGYFLERGPSALESDVSFSTWNFFTQHSKKQDETKFNLRQERNKKIEGNENTKRWWAPFFIIGGLLQFGITLNVIVGTVNFKEKNETEGVTQSAIFYAIYFALFPALALVDILNRETIKFEYIDKGYILLSFTSKIAL